MSHDAPERFVRSLDDIDFAAVEILCTGLGCGDADACRALADALSLANARQRAPGAPWTLAHHRGYWWSAAAPDLLVQRGLAARCDVRDGHETLAAIETLRFLPSPQVTETDTLGDCREILTEVDRRLRAHGFRLVLIVAGDDDLLALLRERDYLPTLAAARRLNVGVEPIDSAWLHRGQERM